MRRGDGRLNIEARICRAVYYELVALAERLLIKREARLEAQRRPTVRVVAPAVAEVVAGGEYCVPGGAFLYPGHTWARIDPDGQVWTGLDDFARKALSCSCPAGVYW